MSIAIIASLQEMVPRRELSDCILGNNLGQFKITQWWPKAIFLAPRYYFYDLAYQPFCLPIAFSAGLSWRNYTSGLKFGRSWKLPLPSRWEALLPLLLDLLHPIHLRRQDLGARPRRLGPSSLLRLLLWVSYPVSKRKNAKETFIILNSKQFLQ